MIPTLMLTTPPPFLLHVRAEAPNAHVMIIPISICQPRADQPQNSEGKKLNLRSEELLNHRLTH